MRITFGIHRGKDVADIPEDHLRSLLEWIERKDDFSPTQKKDMDRQATAIRRELSRRDTETADTERVSGPATTLAHMTGSTVKLLLGFAMIRAETGGADPFPASVGRLAEVTGLSPRAISDSKRELVDYGVLSTFTRGDYRLNLEPVEFADSRSLGQFLKSIRGREEDTGESAHYAYTPADVTDTVVTALKVLSPGVEPMDSVIRYARTRVYRLLAQGVTLEEIMRVVRWARRSWDTGDARFAPMLDLTYILVEARFAGYLAAAKSGAAKKGYSIYTDPEMIEKADREAEEILRKKGLL